MAELAAAGQLYFCRLAVSQLPLQHLDLQLPLAIRLQEVLCLLRLILQLCRQSSILHDGEALDALELILRLGEQLSLDLSDLVKHSPAQVSHFLGLLRLHSCTLLSERFSLPLEIAPPELVLVLDLLLCAQVVHQLLPLLCHTAQLICKFAIVHFEVLLQMLNLLLYMPAYQK